MIDSRINNSLIFFVFMLFIFSSLTPMAFGNNTAFLESSETSDLNVQLENLAFICKEPNGFNSVKYEHYKQQLIDQYSFEDSNDNIDSAVKSELATVETISQSNSLSFGPMDSPWPMQSHDVHHTGQSPYSTANNPGIEKWRFSEDHGIEMSPVIDIDGVIYICDGWGDIIAVYPNGTIKWKFTAEGQILGSSPAIDEDGTIYIGSWDGGLYALNPDGTKKWRFGSGAQIASSPVIADDRTIYFGCMGPEEYGRIYALNPNGTEKWHYDADWYIISDPAIGVDGTVYIGSLDSYLYALYPNGTLKWRFKTGDRIYGSPSIADDGTIYIGSSWDGYLYALYPNGTMKWKYSGAGTPNNPSIGADGTIYAGYLYHLVALNPDGSLKWSFYVGDNRWIGKSAPAISADGTIYFGTKIGDAKGGEIIAVNPNGTEKWRKMISEEWVDSSPAIAEDGTVYIGSTSEGGGYLHAFGAVESNSPPEAPFISGETNGKAGVNYWYSIGAVDPDNNPISLYIEWGDGSTTGWTFEQGSGETWYYEHAWSEKGSYTIRAKARDVFNQESNWTEFEIKISKPRNRVLNCFYLLKFLEQFPLIRFLLKL